MILQYGATFDFVLIYALFGLSTYAALWVGLLSVGSVTFGAIGGFAYAVLANNAGFGFFGGALIGCALGAAAAFILGLVLRRLKSEYFAVATIALVLITQVLVLNAPFTGGPAGTSLPRSGSTLALLAVVIVVAYILARLKRSRFGVAAESVRADPDVASSLGIDVVSVRRTGFVISGAIGGIAGVCMADTLQYINSGTFGIDLALNMLAAVVLGGAYNWAGAIAGAVVFRFIPVLLEPILGTFQTFATGVLLIAIMIYLPRGLIDSERWGSLRRLGRRRAALEVAEESVAAARR
ncbi:branched-chain amino acid ABC transporter permease [soil metagenome]